MLVKCPECDLQISDKAFMCPHCGNPIKEIKTLPKRRSKKRKRLPNGFGQISEIKNANLRKPFRVMVPVGKDENGRPISKLLKPQAYFETYNDAYTALVEYNKNPYDLSPSITVQELYDKWMEEYCEKNMTEKSLSTITSSWAYCSELYSMRVVDLRARHIKGCIEYGTAIVKGETRHTTPWLKARIKSTFNVMLDYALEHDLVERNRAREFSLPGNNSREMEDNRREHIPYTDEEMDLLWNAIGRIKYTEVLIAQCYMGWRPQELGNIMLQNVDLEAWTIVGGMKTDAGKDRLVPIHPRVRGIVSEKYHEAIRLNSPYLFNCTDARNKNDTQLTYDKYKVRFSHIRDELRLNPNHRPHDGRVHFITTAKKYHVDEYAIKYIVGHDIDDVTERVYTHREASWLHEEIAKIK